MNRCTPTRAPDPHQLPHACAATRRTLFGTMGAMLLLTPTEAGPAKAAELDGELLALCAEAVRIDEESERWADIAVALPDGDPGLDGALDRASANMPRYHEPVERVRMPPPRTPEGLSAKAALALSYTEEGGNSYDVALAVLRAIGGAGA